ncbi:hypothetical protein MTO96_049928 [Rhipicephalus appendiculatus]
MRVIMASTADTVPKRPVRKFTEATPQSLTVDASELMVCVAAAESRRRLLDAGHSHPEKPGLKSSQE